MFGIKRAQFVSNTYLNLAFMFFKSAPLVQQVKVEPEQRPPPPTAQAAQQHHPPPLTVQGAQQHEPAAAVIPLALANMGGATLGTVGYNVPHRCKSCTPRRVQGFLLLYPTTLCPNKNV